MDFIGRVNSQEQRKGQRLDYRKFSRVLRRASPAGSKIAPDAGVIYLNSVTAQDASDATLTLGAEAVTVARASLPL